LITLESNENFKKSTREVRRALVPRGGMQFTDHQRQEWNLYDPTTNIVGQQHGVLR
jgi:hypothetical protein